MNVQPNVARLGVARIGRAPSSSDSVAVSARIIFESQSRNRDDGGVLVVENDVEK